MTIRSYPVRFLGAGLAAFLTFAAALPLAAQETGQKARPTRSLFEQFAGNTVTGHNTSGVNFSEYHSPDGRIFGYNSGEPAIDACWRTNGPDTICYYYGKGERIVGEFCWRFDPVGDVGYKIRSTNSRTTGIARVEPGNPHGWTDQGQSWTCDRLMSSVELPARNIAAFAGGMVQ